ncbi:hypothetical protein BW41_01715 [Sphingomonas sp. RIT328]|nr:hypothetical protein BW41_01715 [Sphingomonas sp. RIT328]
MIYGRENSRCLSAAAHGSLRNLCRPPATSNQQVKAAACPRNHPKPPPMPQVPRPGAFVRSECPASPQQPLPLLLHLRACRAGQAGGLADASDQSSASPAEGVAWADRRFCHGHRPSISTSSEKLRKVRIRTMPARTKRLSNVGSTATVLMMSAATRNSRPSRIDRPSPDRKSAINTARSVAPLIIPMRERPQRGERADDDDRGADDLDGIGRKVDPAAFAREHRTPCPYGIDRADRCATPSSSRQRRVALSVPGCTTRDGRLTAPRRWRGSRRVAPCPP